MLRNQAGSSRKMESRPAPIIKPSPAPGVSQSRALRGVMRIAAASVRTAMATRNSEPSSEIRRRAPGEQRARQAGRNRIEDDDAGLNGEKSRRVVAFVGLDALGDEQAEQMAQVADVYRN